MSTILVVEDESIIAADIARVLTELGYHVPVTVGTSEEALAAVARIRPALVLMDVQLRGPRDGIETAAILRRDWNVPVVYLTSHSDEHTLRRAKETAPYGYLIKPYVEHELRASIEVALAKHELERRLAERDRWFATTLRSIGDAVIAIDCEQNITFLNHLAERLTGWKAEEAIGHSLEEVFRLVEEAGAPVAPTAGVVLANRVIGRLPPSTRLVTRGDAQIEVDDSVAPILGEDGRLLGGVVVFRDVTEQRALERRAVLSERLASLGTLTAGLAHEVNSPLLVVTTTADVLEETIAAVAQDPELPARLRKPIGDAATMLADIRVATKFITGVVRDLRSFASVGAAALDAVELPDVVERAVRIANAAVRPVANVELRVSVTPFVRAHEGQLVQVVTNLLVNAAQAMPPRQRSENRIGLATFTDQEGRAVIEVRDNGVGIAPDAIGKLFDPFYTTKPVGEGMGLGLSIAHGIVSAFGGSIDVESTEGIGSIFRVVLPPVGADETVVPSTTPTASAPDVPRTRVLLVDDDERVARTLARMLSLTYTVHVETDPRRALERVCSERGYDLLLSDIRMPGLTGPELVDCVAKRLGARAPAMLLMTGGVADERAAATAAALGIPILAKPMARQDLIDVITDAVLRRRAATQS